MRRFSFSKRSRLRSRVEFDRVFQHCVRSSDQLFTVLARRNKKNHPRLGLVISARTAGNAVARHRVKRTIRESFRLAQHSLPPVDIVILSRPGLSQHTNAVLAGSLEKHWQRISRKCAS